MKPYSGSYSSQTQFQFSSLWLVSTIGCLSYINFVFCLYFLWSMTPCSFPYSSQTSLYLAITLFLFSVMVHGAMFLSLLIPKQPHLASLCYVPTICSLSRIICIPVLIYGPLCYRAVITPTKCCQPRLSPLTCASTICICLTLTPFLFLLMVHEALFLP